MTSTPSSNCKTSAISLQSTTNNQRSFRVVLKRELTEFENKMRINDPLFDVYEWLGEKLGYNSYTIRKWLYDNDPTGTKLGTKDLELVCIFINTWRPAQALFIDIKSNFDTRCDKICEYDLKSIELGGLKASAKVGELCKDLALAFEDEIFEESEKKIAVHDIDEAIATLNNLKSKISD